MSERYLSEEEIEDLRREMREDLAKMKAMLDEGRKTGLADGSQASNPEQPAPAPCSQSGD